MERMTVGFFAEHILGRKLYWYQEVIADAVIDSVLQGKGLTFTVMMARQMGKNETSAIIEAYLLCCMEEGTIVKAAPTYRPQIINSKLRLKRMLEAPLLRDRVYEAYGYIIGMAQDKAGVRAQVGPRLMLFSAGPESNVVGATASLLLEIDEAQDVSAEKYSVELRPMASTTNATCVLWGTAWSDDTLLAMQRAHNIELQNSDGIQRHFEFPWITLAAINPNYKTFVESEIARMGIDHLSIRTQYLLLPIAGESFLFNELQRHLLRGSHDWEDEPDEEGGYYVAGVDVGGEERAKPGDVTKGMKRDSTVVTIGKVSYDDLDLPRIEVIHQQWWTGMKYLDQYEALRTLVELWNIRKIVIDKTGLGEGMSSLLVERFGEDRVIPFAFSRPSKSHLTFQLLSLVNGGRLKVYRQEYAPAAVYEECFKQLKLARYSIPGEGLISMFCDPSVSHDDFLISLALCGEAMKDLVPPIGKAAIVSPRPLYRDGRF